MDPNETLARILEAMEDQDREEALEALDDLACWLGSGGFFPDPSTAIDRFLTTR